MLDGKTLKRIKGITFKVISLFILDLDGTFYLGNKLLDGSSDFIESIRRREKRFVFLTNNNAYDHSSYVERLRHMGIDIDSEQIFTSGDATLIYLKDRLPKARVHLLGTPALKRQFKDNGIELTDVSPDVAILAFDMTLTYWKLTRFCHSVEKGIKYIATHPDPTCPDEKGILVDTGSMIELIYKATGRRPDEIIGKPNPSIVELLLKKFHVSKKNAMIIGDRLMTDIKTGINAGITSVLTLSGETKLEELKMSEVKPDFVINSIGELCKFI